jgi:hypothetical protein
MSLVDVLTRSELCWLATLNPEPLTHAEFVAHAWARAQMCEVARRADAARALAKTEPRAPKSGQFMTRDMVTEARRRLRNG